ncbi:hypothetical protein [Nocardiopsis lambiniae]|uniref:Uncharacterized protein n=1 Tax=Nocardiopsis lambiniae TaxID=3075539 RepID=A0ABU2M3E8_9ACTN|nr:hypothetical protein [Nocardiopsis sp. DSM 44743]MDT0326831.1 hypothetical protein [Nocardiopsis sp. DSM 44743]
MPPTPYAMDSGNERPWPDRSGPQNPRTFAQDSVAEAFLSGTPMPQRENPQWGPEPVPGPQAAVAPPVTPPASPRQPGPAQEQWWSGPGQSWQGPSGAQERPDTGGWTRAPRVVGPPRPADPAVINVWGEEETTDPDAEETDVFLVLGADRRARVEKKKEEEEGEEETRTEAEEPRTGPLAPDPASESEGSLLYRGVSLFAPEAGEPSLGASTADDAGGPVDAAGSVDAVSVVPRDPYRAPETADPLPASGGTDEVTDTSAEKPTGLPAEHFDTDAPPAPPDTPERPAGVAGLGAVASVAPVDEDADTPSVEPAATDDAAFIAVDAIADPATAASSDDAPGPAKESVASDPVGRSDGADDGLDTALQGPVEHVGDLGSVASSGHGTSAGGADTVLGVFSGGDLGRMPPPGYATADAASAFLTGRVADTGFSPAYAAPGGYEQRIAAVKPVPVSAWRRAVFTVTRGRVNPG